MASGGPFGPNISGGLARRIYNLNAAPPGICKAGFHEVAEVVRRKGKLGYPPSVATDSQLGYSVAAHQSAELLFD